MKRLLISALLLTTSVISPKLQNSPNIENVAVVESQEMNSDVLFTKYTMDTSFDSLATKTTRDVFTYTMKHSTSTHLATWTYKSPHEYSLKSLTEIAKDYERNHPGWIVLGGVNAEGYYEKELTNAFIQDGDVIRKDVSAEIFKELIGFKKDGTHVIKQLPTSSDYPFLKIDDKEFLVKHINELPLDSEIAILTPSLQKQLDLTSYNVISATYEMFRESKKFPGGTLSGNNLGIFLKGKVNGVLNISLIKEVKEYEFFIVTKSSEVVEILQSAKQIKCEYDYTDEFKDVEHMTGYMFKLLENGTTIPRNYVDVTDTGAVLNYMDHTYYISDRERCGIGFKENGEIVLLTTNTKKGGPSQYEVGEMFRILGCKDAYQFDGGGSVTFIKRNEFGDFEMLNTPADGVARSIASGLFVVTKDPYFEQSLSLTTPSSITLNKKKLNFDPAISNVKFRLNDKEYELVGDLVTFKGLNDNTTYKIEVEYEENGQVYTSEIFAKTKTFTPAVTITSKHNGFDIKYVANDENLKIEKIIFDVYGDKYEAMPNEVLKITNLDKDREYPISYEWIYKNEATQEILNGKKEAVTYKTLAYQIPEIKEFVVQSYNDSRIVLKYEYVDPDELVQNAYIVVNDQFEEIFQKAALFRLTDIDLAHQEYDIKLRLEYKTLDGRLKYVTSEKITMGENASVVSNITYDCLGIHTNPLNYTEGEELVLFPATLDGYSFDGWFLNGEKIEKIDATKTGDLTLVARFTKILKTFNITYNTDAEHENPGKFTEGDVITLKDAKKEGYTFKGWMLNGKQVTELKDITSDVTLTAEFEKLDAPTTKKGCGCKKNAANLVFAFTSVIALTCIVLKKKH